MVIKAVKVEEDQEEGEVSVCASEKSLSYWQYCSVSNQNIGTVDGD